MYTGYIQSRASLLWMKKKKIVRSHIAKYFEVAWTFERGSLTWELCMGLGISRFYMVMSYCEIKKGSSFEIVIPKMRRFILCFLPAAGIVKSVERATRLWRGANCNSHFWSLCSCLHNHVFTHFLWIFCHSQLPNERIAYYELQHFSVLKCLVLPV